jgi:hypothetical protein
MFECGGAEEVWLETGGVELWRRFWRSGGEWWIICGGDVRGLACGRFGMLLVFDAIRKGALSCLVQL